MIKILDIQNVAFPKIREARAAVSIELEHMRRTSNDEIWPAGIQLNKSATIATNKETTNALYVDHKRL